MAAVLLIKLTYSLTCPIGYRAIAQNLDGKGKVWSWPHPDKSRTISDCAWICDRRRDCTGFEYAEGASETGACGTYTGGESNVQKDEQRLDNGSNWRSCQKDPICPKGDIAICPEGYTAISQNLDGKGKFWSKPHPLESRTKDDCAKICDSRSGCTGFEYAEGADETGACGTYTGGDSNVMKDEGRLQIGSNWKSCQKDSICPKGYTAVPQNLEGKGKVWSEPNPDRCRTINDCANICEDRNGCTGFEYAEGALETGACATYTGGYLNVYYDDSRLEKGSNWRSCLKLICPVGYTAISQDLNGARGAWSQPIINPDRTIDDCASICNSRHGCTGFEYAKGGTVTGACGTYTGGNIVRDDHSRLNKDSNWRSCLKL